MCSKANCLLLFISGLLLGKPVQSLAASIVTSVFAFEMVAPTSKLKAIASMCFKTEVFETLDTYLNLKLFMMLVLKAEYLESSSRFH